MAFEFSIWSQYYNTKDPEEAILEFEKDGLGVTELSSEHITTLLEREGDLAEIGREFANFSLQHGIKILQAHIIFPSPIVTDPDEIDHIERQLKLLCGMGVKRGVMHCDEMKETDGSLKEKIEKNVAALKVLAAKAEKYGVTVCLENLRHYFNSIDVLNYVIDAVGSDMLAICLDTGHLNIAGTDTQRDFILKAGKRLKALHIANNDGTADQHLAPFSRGNIDFFEVARALREIGYDGIFNYEIGGEAHPTPTHIKHIKYLAYKAGYDYLMSEA